MPRVVSKCLLFQKDVRFRFLVQSAMVFLLPICLKWEQLVPLFMNVSVGAFSDLPLLPGLTEQLIILNQFAVSGLNSIIHFKIA